MREIIKHFCVVLSVVVIVYLAVDFFEKIDSFLEAGVPAIRAFFYFLFKVPFIVTQILPISLLISLLVTFGLMSKRNEFIALKSSGVSIYHLFKPAVVLGLLGAAILTCLSEIVVPATMPQVNRIWLQDVRGKRALATIGNKWVKGNHAFFKISQYHPENQIMYGFTAFFLDDQFQLRRRLDAQRGQFRENRWVLQNLLVQTFNPTTGMLDVMFHKRQAERIELHPEDLLQVTPATEEMSCRVLWEQIRKFESEGDDATRYRVDLHDKMARPLACLIMCLIGTAVAVRGKLREGLPVIVSYGIGIAFLYYIVLSLCISIGYGGILPPVVAAWSAHFIFLCLGGAALIYAQS